MVYIHVKKVGGKKYYTLRVSVREKNKVMTRDLENLGTDISKIKIGHLEKKYKKEIRQSYRTIKKFLEENHYLDRIGKEKLKKSIFFGMEELKELEAAKLHFDKVFLKLDKQTQKDIYQFFLIKFAVSSTSIEGNTINLKQASQLLLEDILPKDKTLREIYDLQNSKTVFSELLDKKPGLSLQLVEEVHDKLLENIDLRKGYRLHDIRILGQPFKPTPGRYVKADMRMLLQWYHKNKNKIHPLALAIFFHHKFERIHPFSDGNGRTGRILMNHVLMKQGYPPLIIPKKFRGEYISLLQKADKALTKSLLNVEMEHYQGLFSFMVDQYNVTYWNTFLV